MNIELKDFQTEAVEDLLTRLVQAKREVAEGYPQAVILSSPTGSGKTVITTKLMESILEGEDENFSEPDATFLWLSDQPELNEQSRKKIAAISTRFRAHELVIVDSDFDSQSFETGRIYFLNTQKLGKDKNLVTKGNRRQYTIWETIENTGRELRDRFYLIIDEAHRGMNRSSREQSQVATIVQKFVVGEAGVLDPVKLIIGVTATPDRFNRFLENTGRTARPVTINPEEVRSSGLLKDKIILFHPTGRNPTDWTLLAEGAKQWNTIRDTWNSYTNAQGLPGVNPVMVVQVEDGNDRLLTKTDLELAIRTLEQEVGSIKNEELAHAFQEETEIVAGTHRIQKIDASSIQDAYSIKFVFFKMALTTGWDCPRAEVMVSFRKAHDHTLIAQLIGRMVRTPLARRIENHELLNSVFLYLPHYDRKGVDSVVNHLKSDPDTVPPTDIEEGKEQVLLGRRTGQDDVFNALSTLPTYRIERIRKQSNTRRLIKLGRLLTALHSIDADALASAKQLVIDTLDSEMSRLRKEDSEFAKLLSGCTDITINAVTIEQGTWRDLGGAPQNIRLSDRNVDDLFRRGGQRLGEGLEIDYWQAKYDPHNPNRPKLELFLTTQNQRAWDTLEKACEDKINELFKRNKGKINELKSSERELYKRVREVAKQPEVIDFEPPIEIMVRVGEKFTVYDKHLYVDIRGEYRVDLNSWEEETILAEIKRPDVVGWMRNYDRKPWALAVPYETELGTGIPTYPDFLVVRRDDGRLLVDILEPHRPDLDDSWKKACGLALYAKRHYMSIGRIEIIRRVGKELRRLSLIEPKVHNKVLKWVKSNSHLDQLFDEL